MYKSYTLGRHRYVRPRPKQFNNTYYNHCAYMRRIIHGVAGPDEHYSAAYLAVQRNLPNSLSRGSIGRPPFLFFNGFHMTGRDSNSHFLVRVAQTPGRRLPPPFPPDNQCDLNPITRYYSYIFFIFLFFPFRVPTPSSWTHFISHL